MIATTGHVTRRITRPPAPLKSKVRARTAATSKQATKPANPAGAKPVSSGSSSATSNQQAY